MDISSILTITGPTAMSVILLVISSLYFRLILQICGQSWIKTIAHTATLTLLPILTLIITNLISGNIALSLGMVGALSIVRFRNPVRSPLELSVYFGSITMGIAAAVNIKWLIFMVVAITFVVFVLFIVNFLHIYFLRSPFFITSFSEGNSLSTLKIVSNKDQEKINDSKLLISKSSTNNEVTYVLASTNFEALQNIEKNLIESDGISSIQLNQ